MRKISNAFAFLLLYICFFLSLATCSNRLDSEYFWLEWGKTRNVEASFSYPGRYVHTFKKRNVRDKILRLIEGAGFTIDLWVYSFEDPEILEALKKANARGVKIGIVADPEKNMRTNLKVSVCFENGKDQVYNILKYSLWIEKSYFWVPVISLGTALKMI
ncbi:PLD-like domain protein [Leptospira weilii serovar Topaz str. LT2116]|uniref:PLD-like domain protein n=1 Tax=Leptospira weilii serovar Topaz str. LT2116 TaxID=1088540 RepID=M3ERV6_9LEPT|nr:PLD-like domain protein [Leptospira weilii serovar Topaz str. LT2116]